MQIRVRVRVRVQKGRNLTGSGILGLKKACQVEHGTTQTLLLQQFYHMETHAAGGCHLQVHDTMKIKVRLPILRCTKPRAPGILGLKENKGRTVLHQNCFFKTFLLWDTHLAGGCLPQLKDAKNIRLGLAFKETESLRVL